MKKYIIPAVITAIGLSFLAGNATNNRRAAVNDQFCTLYTTFVQQIDKSLAGVTIEQAKTDPKAYNRGYKAAIQLEDELLNQAPCQVKHRTPANLLQHPPTLPTSGG